MDNIIEKFDKNIEEIYLKCLDPKEKHNIADCLVKEIQKYKRQYWKLLGIRASFVKWNLICEDSKFEIFIGTFCGICGWTILEKISCKKCFAKDICRYLSMHEPKETLEYVNKLYKTEYKEINKNEWC